MEVAIANIGEEDIAIVGRVKLNALRNAMTEIAAISDMSESDPEVMAEMLTRIGDICARVDF